MRVYEFSKESGISSRDLLAKLKKAGFKVPSHMSVLSDDAIIFLKKDLLKKMPMQEQKAQDKQVPSIDSMGAIQKNTITQSVAKKSNERSVVKTATIETEKQREQKTIILVPMLVSDLAQQLSVPVNELILTLLKSGIVAPKNKMLPEDIIETIARHYEAHIIIPTKKTVDRPQAILARDGEKQQERPPVVVVMGHVDHGKTTLLDFIRNTRVAAREKGGITQHLGAYHVATAHGGVIFLDTPGHEAFTKIRSRGANVADIVVLVIAADDGVMPQTLESIKVAKEMHVPIVVAMNKIDKVDAQRLEIVKRQLAQHDLLPEDWGGQTVAVPISAKVGTGVDQLIELLVLQAQMMELKADPDAAVKGYVLESKLQKGLGAVGTLLCQQGTVRIGDYFVCGNTFGRVSSLIDSEGNSIKEAGPSIPVQISGFNELPEAGSHFEVVAQKDYKKFRSSGVQAIEPVRAKNILIKDRSINLLIKTDTHSSKEALIDSIYKLGKKIDDVDFVIVSAGIGDISETDIDFASATKSLIVGLHVKAEPNALTLAQRLNVSIERYDIIYKLLEALQERAENSREVKMIKTKIGEAIVRKVFDIKGVGVIAGCYVQDGRFVKEGSVVVWRGRKEIGQGKIQSLQRANKNVKEVHTGYECAFGIQDLNDFKIDDRIECYIEVPESKK